MARVTVDRWSPSVALAAPSGRYPARVSDPLMPLLDLAEVAAAVDSARADVDAAFAHRALRRGGARVAVEVGLRDAVAGAALSGAGFAVEDVRLGTVDDPVVQAALRIATDLPRLAPRWSASPPQVLARLDVLAGGDGRPVRAADRVATVLDVVRTSTAPALVRAAVVHGELLATEAFSSGLVARAAGRLTLISAGLDPRGLLPVSIGHLQRQPEYVGAAGAFATGTPDGLRSWLKHCAAAVSAAAAELTAICEEI